MQDISPTAEKGALAGRIASAPHLSAPEDARRRVDEWLAEIDSATGVLLKGQFADNPKAHALILGIADGSSWLWDLVRADPAGCRE